MIDVRFSVRCARCSIFCHSGLFLDTAREAAGNENRALIPYHAVPSPSPPSRSVCITHNVHTIPFCSTLYHTIPFNFHSRSVSVSISFYSNPFHDVPLCNTQHRAVHCIAVQCIEHQSYAQANRPTHPPTGPLVLLLLLLSSSLSLL